MTSDRIPCRRKSAHGVQGRRERLSRTRCLLDHPVRAPILRNLIDGRSAEPEPCRFSLLAAEDSERFVEVRFFVRHAVIRTKRRTELSARGRRQDLERPEWIRSLVVGVLCERVGQLACRSKGLRLVRSQPVLHENWERRICDTGPILGTNAEKTILRYGIGGG